MLEISNKSDKREKKCKRQLEKATNGRFDLPSQAATLNKTLWFVQIPSQDEIVSAFADQYEVIGQVHLISKSSWVFRNK